LAGAATCASVCKQGITSVVSRSGRCLSASASLDSYREARRVECAGGALLATCSLYDHGGSKSDDAICFVVRPRTTRLLCVVVRALMVRPCRRRQCERATKVKEVSGSEISCGRHSTVTLQSPIAAGRVGVVVDVRDVRRPGPIHGPPLPGYAPRARLHVSPPAIAPTSAPARIADPISPTIRLIPPLRERARLRRMRRAIAASRRSGGTRSGGRHDR